MAVVNGVSIIFSLQYMQLENHIMPYLQGEKFDNGLKVTISRKGPLVDRLLYLSHYAKGKKIVHVGCVDHLPLIEKKIANNIYLYKRLEEVAARQFGIDNSEEGIRYMQDVLKCDNVAVEDILNGPIHNTIQNEQWDSMILGEILEHIDNPVLFLSTIRARYKPYVKQLVITVPNALSINNTMYSWKNTERINTDHRYWFTPYTLNKILLLAGFTPVSHDFATYYPLNGKGVKKVRNIFLKYLLTRNPVFRSDLIMIADF
jgi:2-polyprenyl-3-methyl-5-hydroxy-6-metoxy-1,4-benzoquinol methylase